MSLFMVSFPILVGVGLLVLLATLPIYGMVLAEGFRGLPGIFDDLLVRMRHGL
jgi:flagellar biosynthesis protein FliR